MDYISTSRILNFGPSSNEVEVAIPITDSDSVIEPVEQFFARLALADQNTDVDVQLDPSQSTIEIIDTDSKQKRE